MKLSRLASYLFLGSFFGIVFLWGYLPRVWLMGWPQTALLGVAAVSLVAWFVFSLEALRIWIKKRSTQFALGLVITAVLSVVLLGTVNWLAVSYNVKKDLTSNQFHTLSDQTKKIAGGLKEDISIRVWTTSPERMSTNLDLRRFLENYRIAGNGKIKVEIKNPNEDRPGAAADNVKRDNIVIVKSASGREARVENFTDTKGEEQITNAIVQAIKGQKKMVCFVGGHGEINLNSGDAQGMSQIKSALEGSSYQTKEVVLATSEAFPTDCEVVVMAGPRSEGVEREMKMIHEYLAKGGKAIALFGPGTPAGWRKLAADYGVSVRGDLIIDPRVQPPIAIATKNFAQDVEVVKSFGRLVIFPEASSIEVTAKPKDGESVSTFISSEAYTFAKTGDLKALKSLKATPMDLKGPLAVGVLVKKTIATATDAPQVNPDKPAPHKPLKKETEHHGAWWRKALIPEAHAQEMDDEAPPAEAGFGAPERGGEAKSVDGEKPQKNEMTLIVYSNHNFVMNSFVSQMGNMDLFLNSVNFLLKDQDLMGIRPREVRQASLAISSENIRQVYATVLLLAGAFLVGAILIGRRRSISG